MVGFRIDSNRFFALQWLEIIICIGKASWLWRSRYIFVKHMCVFKDICRWHRDFCFPYFCSILEYPNEPTNLRPNYGIHGTGIFTYIESGQILRPHMTSPQMVVRLEPSPPRGESGYML